MHRHSPVRNQRSKGIKIKHVLQICLLVAVCCWLLFQIKRSHNKKKDFESSDTKNSVSTETIDEVIKLGRKDLQPKEIEKGEDEDDEHEEQEEHETEEEDKIEEENSDEIDENEQEKSDEEEDTLNGSEEKDDQSQTADEGSSEDHDQDEVDRNIHEAREEHYKADDASSAVTHEHENQTLDNSSENLELGISEHENRVDNGEEINTSQDSTIKIKEKDGETAENGASSNTTMIQETGSELANSSNENGPSSDTTVITSVLFPGNPSGISSDDSLSDSSSTPTDETRNMEESERSSKSTNTSEVVESQTISKLNESTAKENSPGSSKTEAETDAGMERTEETLDSAETEDPDEVQQDAIDSTDFSHLEDNEVQTDVDALPDIETDDGNSEDTAAE